MAKTVLLAGGPQHGEHVTLPEFDYRIRIQQPSSEEVNDVVLGPGETYAPLTKYGDYAYSADCKDTINANEVFIWTGWRT